MSNAATMETPTRDNEGIFSEFHDPQRIALVHQILEKTSLTEMPRGNLFPFWFCDKDELEWLSEQAGFWDRNKRSPSTGNLSRLLEDLVLDVPGVWVRPKANPFQPRGRKRMEPGADPSPSKKKERERDLPSDCKTRDHDMCLVTKLASPTLEAAHIVPFRLCKSGLGDGDVFDRYIKDWWGIEWAHKVRELLIKNSAFETEFVGNLMTLSSQVHAYWGKAMCAFRPLWINEQKTERRLGFHWLPLLPKTIKRSDLISATENPFDGDDRVYLLPTHNIGLFNYTTDNRILPGDVFTITTDNPDTLPLPSWDLLLLMWHLSRIAAMQGAGEDSDDDDDDSDDDVDLFRSLHVRKLKRPRLEVRVE